MVQQETLVRFYDSLKATLVKLLKIRNLKNTKPNPKFEIYTVLYWLIFAKCVNNFPA